MIARAANQTFGQLFTPKLITILREGYRHLANLSAERLKMSAFLNPQRTPHRGSGIVGAQRIVHGVRAARYFARRNCRASAAAVQAPNRASNQTID